MCKTARLDGMVISLFNLQALTLDLRLIVEAASTVALVAKDRVFRDGVFSGVSGSDGRRYLGLGTWEFGTNETFRVGRGTWGPVRNEFLPSFRCAMFLAEQKNRGQLPMLAIHFPKCSIEYYSTWRS